MSESSKEPSVIELVSFQDEEGADYWVYLAIPLEKLEAYRKCAEGEEPFSILEFGEPLAFGPGTEPPPDVRQRMKEVYGATSDFEQKIKKIILEEI